MTIKERILQAAVDLSLEGHYMTITRGQVASRASAGVGTINFHFGTMDGLRDAVVGEAIQSGYSDILAQAVVSKHPLLAGRTVVVV